MAESPPPDSRDATTGPSSPSSLSRSTSFSDDEDVRPSRGEGSEVSRRYVAKRKPLSISEQDESVMIAVRALDDMRSRAGPARAGTSYQYAPCTHSCLSCSDYLSRIN